MKDFLRNGFDLILKHIISQLGMTMFGLAVIFAVNMIAGKDSPLLLAASGLGIALYLFLIYVHTWEYGSKDKIKIDGGRMKYEPFKGLYIAIVANALNILLSLLMCIGFYAYDFVALAPNWAGQLFAVTNIISRALNGMYLGAIVYLFPTAEATPPYMFLLIVIPAVIISFLAYYFGANNKRLFPPKNSSKK